MAVGVGFEPTERFHAQRFSRPPHSTTLPPHLAPDADAEVRVEGGGLYRPGPTPGKGDPASPAAFPNPFVRRGPSENPEARVHGFLMRRDAACDRFIAK